MRLGEYESDEHVNLTIGSNRGTDRMLPEKFVLSSTHDITYRVQVYHKCLRLTAITCLSVLLRFGLARVFQLQLTGYLPVTSFEAFGHCILPLWTITERC